MGGNKKLFSYPLTLTATLAKPVTPVPLRELRPSSGSGYETYSGLSDSDDESPTSFSPIKFTDSIGGGEGGVVSTGVTTEEGGGGAGGVEGKRSPAGQGVQTSQKEQMLILFSPDSESKQFPLEPVGVVSSIATGRTADSSSDVHSENVTQNSSHNGPQTSDPQTSSHSDPQTSSHSDPQTLPNVDSDVTITGSEEKSVADALANDTREESNCPSSSGTGGNGCGENATNNSSSLFYSFQDMPDMEGGVMIDIFDSADSFSRGDGADGEARKMKRKTMCLALDSAQEAVGSHEEQSESLSVHECKFVCDPVAECGMRISFLLAVPANIDIEECSPMGNPFLEAEQSSEKEGPSFTLAIISRRSRFRAGTCGGL